MLEGQDLTSRRCQLPSLVLDRVAAIAQANHTHLGHVYRTAIRTVALCPPEHPVAYPSVIHVARRGSIASFTMSRHLREVARVLEARFFYSRQAWLYLYGTATSLPTFDRLLGMTPEALDRLDEERYRYWSTGGQPACIPTTARAPGVRSRRRSSRP